MGLEGGEDQESPVIIRRWAAAVNQAHKALWARRARKLILPPIILLSFFEPREKIF